MRKSRTILDELRSLEAQPQPVNGELRRRIHTPDHALRSLWDAWPDIRQLIDGWKCGTPADEWSEWDEQVRINTIELSFILKAAVEAIPASPADTGADSKRLSWLESHIEELTRISRTLNDTWNLQYVSDASGCIAEEETTEGIRALIDAAMEAQPPTDTREPRCFTCDLRLSECECGPPESYSGRPAEPRRAQFVFDERSRIPVEQAIALGLPAALAGKPPEPPRTWLLWFDDKDCVDEVFTDYDVARKRYETCSASWSCTLFGSIVGRPAEPAREWQLVPVNPNHYAGLVTSEEWADRHMNAWPGTWKKQWRVAAGPWQDADTSAAEGENK